ncbi:MAG TPA: hypothetical protein VGL56_13575 [Fimbriimonadaceae bacterium]
MAKSYERAQPAAGDSLSHFQDELKGVPRGAPFWAVRRFRTGSPDGKIVGDEQLRGYSVFLKPDVKRVVIRAVSDNPKGFELCSKVWGTYLKNEGFGKPLEMVKEDARTTRVVLDATAPNGEVPVFILFAVLGHPIVV